MPTSTFESVLRSARLVLTLLDPAVDAQIAHLLACYNTAHAHAAMGDTGLRTLGDVRKALGELWLDVRDVGGEGAETRGGGADEGGEGKVDYGRVSPVYIVRLGSGRKGSDVQGEMIGFVALSSVATLDAGRSPFGTPDAPGPPSSASNSQEKCLPPHMGWLLLAPYLGLGYATEAALRAREYWVSLGVWTIRATVKPGNEKSLRVAARLGMRACEGLNADGKVEFWWKADGGEGGMRREGDA